MSMNPRDIDATTGVRYDETNARTRLPSWISPTSLVGRYLLQKYGDRWEQEIIDERFDEISRLGSNREFVTALQAVLGNDYVGDDSEEAIISNLAKLRYMVLDGSVSEEEMDVVFKAGEGSEFTDEMQTLKFYSISDIEEQNAQIAQNNRGLTPRRQRPEISPDDWDSADDLLSLFSIISPPSFQDRRRGTGNTLADDIGLTADINSDGSITSVSDSGGSGSSAGERAPAFGGERGMNAYSKRMAAYADRGMPSSVTSEDSPAGTATPGSPRGGGSGGVGGGGSGGVGGGSQPPGGGAINNAPSWNGIPGDGEVWKIGNETAVAYKVGEEDNDPYVIYTFPSDEALNYAFPEGVPAPKKYASMSEATAKGRAFDIGTTSWLDASLGDSWDEIWERQVETEKLLSPWLEDDEVLATMTSAFLEGRDVTVSELESTEYFGSRSREQVQYIANTAGMTEEEYDNFHLTNRQQTRQLMEEAGIRNPNNGLVNFVADKFTRGQFNEAKWRMTVEGIANPYGNAAQMLDEDVVEFTQGINVESLKLQANSVRDLVEQWIGPHHSGGWTEQDLERWAGLIMDDPNAEADLIEELKGSRMALYPEYENSSLTYRDISRVWENQMQQTWGRIPGNDGDYAVLDRVIRANDSNNAGQILREEGLKRGVGRVVNEMAGGANSSFGGQVVGGS